MIKTECRAQLNKLILDLPSSPAFSDEKYTLKSLVIMKYSKEEVEKKFFEEIPKMF